MSQSSRDQGDFPVKLADYISEAEAATDLAALQSVGIDAQVHGNVSGDVLGYYGLALRKVELVVPSRQAEQAARFLKEFSARTQQRESDWTCSACQEANGKEFDDCWSCGKPWSKDDADLFETTQVSASPIPQGSYILPSVQNTNPYAAPVSGPAVEVAAGEEMENLIRSTWRGTVLSIAFPPILVVVLLVAFHGLSKAGAGQILASREQIRRLLFAAAIAALLLIGGVTGFFALQLL